MDYTAANHELWNIIIQLGLIAGAVLTANFLRQKIPFIRKSLMPIAVLAGFILLIIEYVTPLKMDTSLLEMIVYHGIALGFIAMSLRVPPERVKDHNLTGLKSGAVIVSSYMVQAVTGLVITLTLSYTFMPDLFRASGLLLPMGYGQGPGQANNIGSTYESLGFTGGHSFGLSIAAAGYLVACIVGVIILNVWLRKGKITSARSAADEQPTVDFFQGKNEIPISDSIDKLSIQISIVLLIYLITFLASWGITSGISAISEGIANSVNSLIWGFNFIIGSALATLLRVILENGRKKGIIHRQYQNNFLLNRISGFFFDLMIVAGIAAIKLEDIRDLWVPFILLAVAGAITTWVHLSIVCRKVYPDYYIEGLISMYGMMTGTISSGVLLLREVDPNLSTPAANNLVTGSSVGILFGLPVLLLVGLAPRSDLFCWITLGIAALYLGILLLILFFAKPKKSKKGQ